jgi:lipopolysaccharide transport system permease protein
MSLGDVWVIERRRAGVVARLREAWQRRTLIRYFGMRLLYRQSAHSWLGPAWILLRPLGPIVLGTAIFGGLLRAPSHGLPYFLFYLVGTLAWSLFETGVTAATRSLEVNRRIVSRIYFPRLVLPVAGMMPALTEAAIHAALLVLAVIYYRLATGRLYVELSPRLAAGVLALAAIAIFALAVGLCTSLFQARSRDTRYALRYVMRFWFFVTPVIYPMDTVGPRWRWLVSLNPLAPLIEAFRWGVLGVGTPDPGALVLALVMIAGTVVGGLMFFDWAETNAIDRM